MHGLSKNTNTIGGARFPEGVPIFLRKLCGGARFPGV